MQTSYFAKQHLVPNPISISAFPPKFYTGACYPSMAPTKQILRAYKSGDIDQKEYRVQFADWLSLHNPKLVHRALCDIHDTDNYTLLCYEKPGDFCHRHLVREWLNEHLNLKAKEFSFAPSHRLF